jgi:dihydropteroate synthase
MGIINVTEDSFFAPSRLSRPDEAVRTAAEMVCAVADILDIGAESTRPGALSVPACEETAAVIPVIEAVRDAMPEVPISVDTRKAEVARRSLEAGADIVNDVSGLLLPDEAPGMIELLLDAEAPYVLTHTKGTPDVMQISPRYDDFLDELADFFEEKISLLTGAGVRESRIILDPGVGFGKRREDNLDILANIAVLKKFGLPLLIGASRKGFIGKIMEDAGLDMSACLEGTLAVSALCAIESVEIVRVHDVMENRRVVETADAIRRRRNE